MFTRFVEKDVVCRRLLEHIGSGQYGEVHKAIWRTSNSQDTEVAVKQLKTGALTMDRIKFLQEAAIMAQFSNQNVLKLLGMVTQGEDVCEYHTCICIVHICIYLT